MRIGRLGNLPLPGVPIISAGYPLTPPYKRDAALRSRLTSTYYASNIPAHAAAIVCVSLPVMLL